MRNLTLIIVGFLAIKLLCSFGVATVVGPEGTNGEYYVPFDAKLETERIVTCAQGNPVTEEILLRNPTTMYTHKATLNELKAALKIPVGYNGVTAGSGTYTVTYAAAYTVLPTVNVEIIGGSTTNQSRVTSSTLTGFTVTTNNIVNVVGLLPTYPTVNGLTVNVIVTPN